MIHSKSQTHTYQLSVISRQKSFTLISLRFETFFMIYSNTQREERKMCRLFGVLNFAQLLIEI